MKGPTDWISQRRKKAGPTPRPIPRMVVAVADHGAVAEIDGAAQIERIAGAFDIHVADDVLGAGDEQTFRLTVGVILQSEVEELDAGRIICGEGAAAVRPRLG